MDKRNRNIALFALGMGGALLLGYLLFKILGLVVVLVICIAIFLRYAIREELAYRKKIRERVMSQSG